MGTTVGIGPGGIAVGPRQHCRTVTTTVGGTPTANLAAYRAAFLVAAGLAAVAAVIALFVRDSDAATTMRRATTSAAPRIVSTTSGDTLACSWCCASGNR